MIGKDIINLLVEGGYVKPGVEFITLTASTEGRTSINADYSSPQVLLDNGDELSRLKSIEAIAAKLVKLLGDGQVDYDLVAELKGLLNE